jgi:hypothetical protein
MNARYRVTNRLGLFIHGYQLNDGAEVFLSDEKAAPLLAAGAIARASDKSKAKAVRSTSAENKAKRP